MPSLDCSPSSPLCTKKLSDLLLEIRKMILNSSPDNVWVNGIITMSDNITKADNTLVF